MLRAFGATDGIAPPQAVSGLSGSDCLSEETIWQSIRRAFNDEAPWWGCSFAFHFLLLAAIALLAGMVPAIPREPQIEFGAAPPPAQDASPADIDPISPVVQPMELTPPDRDAIIEIASPPGMKDGQANDEIAVDGKNNVDTLATTARPDSARDVASSIWQPGKGPGETGPHFDTSPRRRRTAQSISAPNTRFAGRYTNAAI